VVRAIITDADKDAIEARIQAGESQRAIARSYGVSHQAIQKRRARWGQPLMKQGNVRGANHACWKGGEFTDAVGYRRVYRPETHRANKYIYEHQAVMEDHLGRSLSPSEIVHHINGDRLDNRIENLLVLSRSAHKTLHAQLESLAYELVAKGDIVFDGEAYRWK
jgi:hypothetical protein